MTPDTQRSDPHDDERTPDAQPTDSRSEESDDEMRRRVHELAVANDSGPDVEPPQAPDEQPRH